MADFITGYEASSWFGIAAPKKTPPNIIEILNKEINAGLNDPEIKARIDQLGGVVLQSSPSEFERLVDEEIEKWGKVIRAAKIKAQYGTGSYFQHTANGDSALARSRRAGRTG